MGKKSIKSPKNKGTSKKKEQPIKLPMNFEQALKVAAATKPAKKP
jgi:hypothetical protein